MNRLNNFLTSEVNEYAAVAGKNVTPELVAHVVAGLSHYINEYLAEQIEEQIPEQLEEQLEGITEVAQ